MAAKKIKEDAAGFKFTILDGEKYIRINDIIAMTQYCRRSVERYINSGVLESRKWNGLRLVRYSSYIAWQSE